MNARKPKVVVLDDSEVCRELAAEALEAAGMEVVTGSSGLGASRILHQQKPDCIVVDVSMPALSGDKLVTILRRDLARNVPILLHSDRPKNELIGLARSCGASGAVVKTPDCAALVIEVTALIELRRRATEAS